MTTEAWQSCHRREYVTPARRPLGDVRFLIEPLVRRVENGREVRCRVRLVGEGCWRWGPARQPRCGLTPQMVGEATIEVEFALDVALVEGTYDDEHWPRCDERMEVW